VSGERWPSRPYSMSMTGEVSPVGRGDEVASPDDLRASHEDRDRVVDLLRVAAGDGRLSAEELDQRLEKALTARTYGELAVLTRDLPATRGLVAGARASKPKSLVRIDCHSGSARRDGRWLVPQRIEVRCTSGSVTLDFTEAVIAQPSLQIDADVMMWLFIVAVSRFARPGVSTCPSSCGSRCQARSAAAKSRPARLAGPLGSGSGGGRRPARQARVSSVKLRIRPAVG
jgi:hypothetical protein